MRERGETWYRFVEGEELVGLHRAFGLSHDDLTPPELDLAYRIERQWGDIGMLQEIGRGGDMVAYSHPDLDFVTKFPYDDASGSPKRQWPQHIKYGFFLGKECLGGILAPTIDLPLVVSGESGSGAVVLSIVQQKVKTVEEVIRESSSQRKADVRSAIERAFIELNQRMWKRGILDTDPDWEPNYGLLPTGELVLIDVGGLSDREEDFSYHEGLPREYLYSASLRDAFGNENFRRFFGRNLDARTYAPAVMVRRT